VNVLFLTHRTPYPLDKGERIRAFHVIRALASRGDAVHLVTLRDSREAHLDSFSLSQLMCSTVESIALSRRAQRVGAMRALVDGRPLSLGHFASRRMSAAVDAALATKSIDTIVACSSTMLQFVPPAWRDRTIADLVDADSEKWREYSRVARPPQAWVFALEARRMRAYERLIVETCAATVVVTEREARLLAPQFAPAVKVVSCAVDASRFERPVGSRTRPAAPPVSPVSSAAAITSARIVFLGSMDYRPNIDAVCHFARAILPRIRAAMPSAHFTIVGREPARAVRQLARDSGITVTGAVDDVRPYLWNADVSVAPLRIARGIQNKILEAMAARCPVVCSTEAIAGLRVSPQREVLVADDPAEFADAVLDVVRHPARAASLRDAAHAFVVREHACNVIGAQFVDVIETAHRRHVRPTLAVDAGRGRLAEADQCAG
jgi:sugar transferase (PEP-CTERM/EpsH1 system associated)